MSNTHGIADFGYELQATCEDLLPACITTTTWPTVPVPPSLTLAAFATQGYVRDGQALPYVDQPAATLTLSGSDGTYWLALSRDTATDVAAWTRRAGTHYLFRLSGTRPPDLDGILVFSQVTVAGGVITAVTPASGVTRAEAWRTLGGLGTMATQNASAVAVTGGTATGLSQVSMQGGFVVMSPKSFANSDQAGNDVIGFLTNVNAAGGTNRWAVLAYGDAPSQFSGSLTVTRDLGTVVLGSRGPTEYEPCIVRYQKQTVSGMKLQPTDNDTGPGAAVSFVNAAGTTVGSISTTATATAYNTTSDARLKHSVTPLTGALARLAALRPVAFLWNVDDSPGTGFLAHELQRGIPEAVSGEPDAVDAAGNVVPQGVDSTRVVPWLTAALQELAQQVQALTARLAACEAGEGRPGRGPSGY